MGKECHPAVPKPRKRRTQSNVGESEGISLGEFASSSSAAQGPAPKFDSPSGKQPDYSQRRDVLLSRHDLSHTDSKSFVSLFARGLGNSAVSPILFGACWQGFGPQLLMTLLQACEELLHGIDYTFVANSFTVYRQLTPNFPFVELRPGADVVSMVASRPVLTLAVCTVAASARPEVQSRLSQAFRYTISSKVILGSERSMDLLTGFMVFLAWHHHYMSPHHIYQQLTLLAGIAADLGLYQPWLEPTDPSSALERDRAFVGCYHLCAHISATGFDKPCPLRWSKHLRNCAESAAASGGLASDRALPSILELACAVDEMEDQLRQAGEVQYPIPMHFVELHTRAASQRLKALKRQYPTLGGALVFSAANIHIYQRLLRASDNPESSALIQCACAIKEYVDELMARPPSTLHQMALVDWVNLLEILVLMARVFKPLPSTGGWEAGALTSMLQPDLALDAICSHMMSAPANDTLSPRNEQLLQWLRSISEGIKRQISLDGATVAGVEQAPGAYRQSGEFSEQNRLRPTPGFHYFNYFGNGILDHRFLDGLIGGR